MRQLLVAGCLLLIPFSTIGDILDDSKSPRQQYNVQFRWDYADQAVFELSSEELNQMVGELNDVEVRLDTSDYEGQTAQIYLRLPDETNGIQDAAGVEVEWTTRGIFAPGHTTPGNRALIFEGVVDSPLMIDFFRYTIRVDARKVFGPFRIEPVYEIFAN